MNDPHSRSGVAAPQGGFWWLKGRAGRREYWAYIGAVIVLSLFLQWVPPIVGLVEGVLMAFIQVRRLHDFGRSGWWALAAICVPIAVTVLVYFVASEDAALMAGSIVALAFIVLIGTPAGDPGDNRFGPAPPFSARRLLTGR